MELEVNVTKIYIRLIEKYEKEHHVAGLNTLKLSIIHDPRLTLSDSRILIRYIDTILKNY
jgi:hypothetical protein